MTNQNNEFIKENQNEWKEIGQMFKSQREELGLSKAKASGMVGCASSTLTKFEEGQPVKSSKMIERSYSMALKLKKMEPIGRKDFDSPLSWSHDEKNNFTQILLLWMSANDHTYDLFKYLRGINEGNGIDSEIKNEYTVEFEKLFHKALEYEIEDYERHYQNDLKEYQAYKASERVKELLRSAMKNAKETLAGADMLVLLTALENDKILSGIVDSLVHSEQELSGVDLQEFVKNKFPNEYMESMKEALNDIMGQQEQAEVH
jgi:transcriptional regulator with XRE-family HTH domain